MLFQKQLKILIISLWFDYVYLSKILKKSMKINQTTIDKSQILIQTNIWVVILTKNNSNSIIHVSIGFYDYELVFGVLPYRQYI